VQLWSQNQNRVRLRSRDLKFASLPTSYLSEARPLLGTDRVLDWVGWKRFQVRVVCSTVCATMALNIENGEGRPDSATGCWKARFLLSSLWCPRSSDGGSGGEFVSWSHRQSSSAASVQYIQQGGSRGGLRGGQRAELLGPAGQGSVDPVPRWSCLISGRRADAKCAEPREPAWSHRGVTTYSPKGNSWSKCPRRPGLA